MGYANPPKTIEIPLGDKPYATPYRALGLETCQNLFLERAPSDFLKAPYYYVKIPGLTRLRESAIASGCRFLFPTSGGKIFGVWGNQFVETDATGSWTVRGTLLTSEGICGMAENGAQVLVVDGRAGYIFDLVASTWERITEPTFPGNTAGTTGPTHCVCIDTYFLVNLTGTNSYLWSNLGYQSTTVTDPLTGGLKYVAGIGSYWDGLTSGQGFKLGSPDQILGMAACQNQLWTFGMSTTEIQYDTGNFPASWGRVEGAYFEIGLAAKYSLAKWGTQVFWLGSDKTGTAGVFTNEGYQPKRVSLRGVEDRIREMVRFDDAIGFIVSQPGHTFYVLQFPTADQTWVYDLSTDTWAERTYLQASDGTLHAWRGQFAVSPSGASRTVVADRSSSALYWLNVQAYQNDDPTGAGTNLIQCVKTTPIGFQLGTLVRYNWLQVILQQGVGLQQNNAQGVGAMPVIRLAFSNDLSVVWSNERILQMGVQGAYEQVTVARVLGSARNRSWRVSCTDPVPLVLAGLMANITPAGREG